MKTQQYIGYDYYKRGTATYGILFACLIVYVCGLIASSALTLNATIPAAQRYHSNYWLAIFLTTMRIWSLIIVVNMILYRQTFCCGSYLSCTGFWFILLVPFIVADVMVVGILGSFFRTCNDPFAAAGTYNPCSTPYATGADSNFVFLFAVSVVSLVFLLFFSVFPVLSITVWAKPYGQRDEPFIAPRQQRKDDVVSEAAGDILMLEDVMKNKHNKK